MEINIDNLHHGYIIIGSTYSRTAVDEILRAISIERENNPDLVIHEGPLGIDEARNITLRTSTRPFSGKRVLIIDAQDITPQAQNALLKTLEEPGEGNHFFFIAPYEDLLLPTLRSRLQKVKVSRDNSESRRSPSDFDGLSAKNLSASPESFLKLNPAKRLDFAKKFKDSEKPLGPFLDALLAHLKDSKDTKNVEKVFEMRRFADDSGSDARLILEHLSLVL